jgi:hypothetical protein
MVSTSIARNEKIFRQKKRPIISAANDIRRCLTATVCRIGYYKNNGNALSTVIHVGYDPFYGYRMQEVFPLPGGSMP